MGLFQKKIATRMSILMNKSFLLPILLIPLSTRVDASIIMGVGTEAGATSTVSDEKNEVNKKGLAYSAYFGGAYSQDHASWLTLTLGLQGYAVKGSNTHRTQEVLSRTTLIAADYRWSLWGVEPGISIRANIGKDSSLRAEDKDKMSTTLNAGPIVAYRWSREGSDIVGYITATRDLNVQRELNSSFLAGLQYWIKAPISAAHTPAAIATPQAPEPSPLPVSHEDIAPPTTTSLVLHFKPDTFQFEPNSDKLAKKSKILADEIAKIAASNGDKWSSIEISGHSDSASKNPARNLEVSEQRAWAIHKILIKHGVPAENISSKGYGSSQPLDGVDPKAPENRRIELKFNVLKDAEEITNLFRKYLTDRP